MIKLFLVEDEIAMREVAERHPGKTVVLRTQRQIDQWRMIP